MIETNNYNRCVEADKIMPSVTAGNNINYSGIAELALQVLSNPMIGMLWRSLKDLLIFMTTQMSFSGGWDQRTLNR